jgi:hypothetical protein
MAYSDTSPNVDNYWIGKGIIKFQPEGQTGFVHLGNAPEVEYTPAVDVLDHFSSINLISEEWGSIEITAEVLIDGTTGKFGTALWGITAEVDGTLMAAPPAEPPAEPLVA